MDKAIFKILYKNRYVKKYRKELFKLLLIEFYSLRNNRVAKTFRQGYLLLLTVKVENQRNPQLYQ